MGIFQNEYEMRQSGRMPIVEICLLTCSCDDPCCEADVGVGVITCGSQHCEVHGLHTRRQA